MGIDAVQGGHEELGVHLRRCQERYTDLFDLDTIRYPQSVKFALPAMFQDRDFRRY
jgi:hypothetical protein